MVIAMMQPVGKRSDTLCLGSVKTGIGQFITPGAAQADHDPAASPGSTTLPPCAQHEPALPLSINTDCTTPMRMRLLMDWSLPGDARSRRRSCPDASADAAGTS